MLRLLSCIGLLVVPRIWALAAARALASLEEAAHEVVVLVRTLFFCSLSPHFLHLTVLLACWSSGRELLPSLIAGDVLLGLAGLTAIALHLGPHSKHF